jgi:hypothetical protein
MSRAQFAYLATFNNLIDRMCFKNLHPFGANPSPGRLSFNEGDRPHCWIPFLAGVIVECCR